MAEISVPIEVILGILATVLGATFALNLKQSRCLGRMEEEIKNIKQWANQHDSFSAEKVKLLDDAARRLSDLERRGAPM